MIPPNTPASDRLREITEWGTSAAALQNLRTELHRHQIYPELSREGGQPHLLISEKLTVWAGYSGEVFYWGTEPGGSAESAPSPDVVDVARRIAAQVYPARPAEGESSDVVPTV